MYILYIRPLYDIPKVQFDAQHDNGTANITLPKIFPDDLSIQPVTVSLVVLPWLGNYIRKSPDFYPQLQLEEMIREESAENKACVSNFS